MNMRDAATDTGLRLERITGAVGARVWGVDLRQPLTPAVRERIQQAFDEHLLLTFPDQQELSPEQHMRFSEVFGDHQDLPHIPLVEGYPKLQKVFAEATQSKGQVAGQNWHSDSSFLPAPPLGVAMRGVDVPPYGGDTAFVNMCLVFESLSPALQQMLSGLRAVHSATRLFGTASLQKETRPNMREHTSVAVGDKEQLHPVVRTHPRTGRKALFVNRVYVQRFEGWTAEESAPLLQYLYSLLDRPEFGCRVSWHRHMMLLWDNRFLQHRAIFDYQGHRRELVRTTIQGEVPA
ncbi:TauD/TfdA family dioxygenase [Ramlibacter sp. AW1]|uniref:TauD/TfdA family dioxygenase n=1 Tax=Ramlibacter aurantiacus TaxID=2801330 RepID=A0A936ZN16_9BURK|nr:TauD/TfdA family dioxygenase [Ramlibacter aurantiacus]MBL0420691.1 TauD/TfdA family dioxygenase [Ramlibacter aurantiacus]